MSECNSANKVMLTYISALIGFLRKFVSSVHIYEKDKVLRHILLNLLC